VAGGWLLLLAMPHQLPSLTHPPHTHATPRRATDIPDQARLVLFSPSKGAGGAVAFSPQWETAKCLDGEPMLDAIIAPSMVRAPARMRRRGWLG